MHRHIVLTAVALLALPIAAPAQTFIVKPDMVDAIRVRASAAQVGGAFALTPRANGSGNRSGGGCLVFQPVAGDHRCTTDAGCRAGAKVLFVNTSSPPSGYCVADRRSAKTCWYRPPDSAVSVDARGLMVSRYCVRSGNAPLPAGERIRLAPVSAFPLGAQPTAWRVTTCHNLVPPTPDTTKPGNTTLFPACARGDAVEGRDKANLFGPVKRFQP